MLLIHFVPGLFVDIWIDLGSVSSEGCWSTANWRSCRQCWIPSLQQQPNSRRSPREGWQSLMVSSYQPITNPETVLTFWVRCHNSWHTFQDNHANYVIQCILERGRFEDKKQIVEAGSRSARAQSLHEVR